MKGFFIFERGEDHMNAQGWIRGMIAKNYSSTEFLQLVVTTIHRQLQRWDETIDVVLYQNMFHTVIIIKRLEGDFQVQLELN